MQRRDLMKKMAASFAGMAITKLAVADTLLSSPKTAFQDNQVKVINKGVGGNNTIEMLARIEKDCLAYKPALTILMAGTNDMNSVKYVPLEQYKANLVEMITRIKAVGSKIIIMTILPTYEPYLLTRHPAAFYQPEGVAERRKQVNDAITAIAKIHDIHLLDMGRRFNVVGKVGLGKDSLIQNEANTNKTDGIHPTPDGYRLMGTVVYDYVTDHQLPVSNIVCFGDSITKGDGTVTKESYPAYLLKLLTAV